MYYASGGVLQFGGVGASSDVAQLGSGRREAVHEERSEEFTGTEDWCSKHVLEELVVKPGEQRRWKFA